MLLTTFFNKVSTSRSWTRFPWLVFYFLPSEWVWERQLKAPQPVGGQKFPDPLAGVFLDTSFQVTESDWISLWLQVRGFFLFVCFILGFRFPSQNLSRHSHRYVWCVLSIFSFWMHPRIKGQVLQGRFLDLQVTLLNLRDRVGNDRGRCCGAGWGQLKWGRCGLEENKIASGLLR